MSWDFNQFHFIRPLWLLALPVLWGLWLLLRHKQAGSVWEQHISASLLTVLRVTADSHSNWWRWILLGGWTVCVLGAAGPTWHKIPVPIVKNQHSIIIILDLSPSMLATDLKPNRLTLAKYKLIDILRQRGDGQAALVVYAGDAHIVSPLTDDSNAIEVLLPALHPDIMPAPGSQVENAIELAVQLLHDAQISKGEILLLTDGIAADALPVIRKVLPSSISLSILGVGGADPIPIPTQGGGFLKSASGEIILSAPNVAALKQLASASGGRYSELRSDNLDIQTLFQGQTHYQPQNETDLGVQTLANNSTYDSWADMGYWLIVLSLPFALFCFRKGILYLLPLCLVFPPDSQADNQAQAKLDASITQEKIQPATSNFLQNLWSTPDQRGAKLLEQLKTQQAAQTFRRDDWAGVASYRDGDYSTAVTRFSTAKDITSIYNRANALAFNGELEAAISAYEQVLEQQADHADAKHNKEVIQQLMNQQQQQEQEQSQRNQPPEAQDQESTEPQQTESSSDQSNEPQQQQANEEPGDQNSDRSESQTEAPEPQDTPESQNPSEPQSAPQETQASEQNAQQELKADDSKDENSNQDSEQQTLPVVGEVNNSESLKDSSEQWLRGIKDDPSGLLRRKFEYQAWQRARAQQRSRADQKPSDKQRF